MPECALCAVLAKDLSKSLMGGQITRPEALAVVLRVSELPIMDVLDTVAAKILSQPSFRQTWLAGDGVKAYIDQHVNLRTLEVPGELLSITTLVTDADESGRAWFVHVHIQHLALALNTKSAACQDRVVARDHRIGPILCVLVGQDPPKEPIDAQRIERDGLTVGQVPPWERDASFVRSLIGSGNRRSVRDASFLLQRAGLPPGRGA